VVAELRYSPNHGSGRLCQRRAGFRVRWFQLAAHIRRHQAVCNNCWTLAGEPLSSDRASPIGTWSRAPPALAIRR